MSSSDSSDYEALPGYNGYYAPIYQSSEDEKRSQDFKEFIDARKRKKLAEEEKERQEMAIHIQKMKGNPPSPSVINVYDSSEDDAVKEPTKTKSRTYRLSLNQRKSMISLCNNRNSIYAVCEKKGCSTIARFGLPGNGRKRCGKHRIYGDDFIIDTPYSSNEMEKNMPKSQDVDIRVGPSVRTFSSSSDENIECEEPKPLLTCREYDSISEDESNVHHIDIGERQAFIKMLSLSKNKYACPYHLCKFRTKSNQALQSHINRHEGIKPFPCLHEWCDYRGTTKLDVKQHLKTHSREGYIRKLTEESRILRRLKKWGLSVDTDITIDASRNGCLTDTDRAYSRVDMVISNVHSCILILEVDEDAHEGKYEVSCELSRMSDINAFLRLNSYTLPIFWLRYNPNGKYYVGNQEKKVSREKRELALKNKIFSMMEPGFVPDGNQNIHYMFYSRVSENGPPKILENPHFSEYMKKTVSWGE